MWLKEKGFNSRTATLEEINALTLQATAEEHLLDLDGKGLTPKVRKSAPTASSSSSSSSSSDDF